MEPGVLVNFHGKGGGMDVLERALIEKTARERGWENILDSHPDGVDLGPARHRGQEIFREALLDYWGGACAVTGIDLPDILRASHVKPWADLKNMPKTWRIFIDLDTGASSWN